MTIANKEYSKLRDELLKSDARWVDATKPLREALRVHCEAEAVLHKRRMECLVLVGRIPGLYQPPPRDPRLEQWRMAILAEQARAPWRPVVSPQPSVNSQNQPTQYRAPQKSQKVNPYKPLK
jgi:hypothetical protein